MTRPLLYRLTAILAALCTPEGQPVPQPRANCARLARHLEVHPRTIKRDLDFLRDALCLPIGYSPSRRTFFLERPAKVNLRRLLILTTAQKGGV